MRGLAPDRSGLEAMCDYNEQIAPRFQACVQPFLDYFDATFIHMDYLIQGYVWGMHSRPDIFHYYLIDGDGFKTDPLSSDPSLWWPQVFVWPTHPEGGFKDELNQGMSDRFGVHTGISFCFKDREHHTTIAMGCHNMERDLINMALKEYALMDRLRDQILNEMKKEVEQLEKRLFPVAQYVGDRFYMPMKVDSKSSDERIQMLLNSGLIQKNDLELLKAPLDLNERRCAYLYFKGYTTDGLSEVIDLPVGSCRRLLHQVKQKLGAANKIELLEVLKKLDLLEYFNHRDQLTDKPNHSNRSLM